MEISFDVIKYYNNFCWFFYFRKYRYIKGFNIRLFGIHVNLRDKDSTNKLIHIANVQKVLKENKIGYGKK